MKVQDTRTLAIVRDDTEYYDLERALLEKGGYEVVRVGRSDLVAKAVQLKPRVIVLDVGPEGRDLELADLLRKEDATRTTGILALGGRTGITKRSAMEHGINRILFKPFSPGRFLGDVDALSQVTRRRHLELDVVLTRTRPQRVVVRGTTVNVSPTGLLLYTSDDLGIGNKFTLQGSTGDASVKILVKVVRKASELGPGYYGLIFRQSDAAERLWAAGKDGAYDAASPATI